MTNSWQEVSLKEVAKPISRSVPVEAGTEYRTIGVKWWGMGAYERETIDGSRTAAKTLSIVREGDLIINKIWVRHGSVAIAGKDVDGCAGSGEFPTFELDLNCIEPKWIHWQTKMKSFWGKCDSFSQGTSGKNRIKPELFLTIKIPLPPLEVQRRILERIEVIADRIAKAQSLREEADREMEILRDALLLRVFSNLEKQFAPVYIGESNLSYNNQTRNPQKDNPNREFLYVDIAAVENGTGKITSSQKIMGSNAPSRARRVIKENDILLSTVRPNLKAFAIVPSELDNQICSTGFAVFSNKPEILPKFLLYQFLSPYFVNQAIEAVTGGHYPALNDKAINSLQVILPPLDEQRRIVAYLDSVQARLASLRELQSQTGEELDALLPSVLDKAFQGEL